MPKRPRPRSAPSNDDPLATFLRARGLEISVEEVLHVTPVPEESESLRQHNHVTLRAGGGKRGLTLCVTALNWDDVSPEPTLVLHTLATEAATFERTEGNFLRWAVALDWDPDSRAVERRFRQTAELCRALRALLGDDGYDALLGLADEMVERLIRDE